MSRVLIDTQAFFPKEITINAGDSIVVAPGGKVLAGPMRNDCGILYADLDEGKVGVGGEEACDDGHAARPDWEASGPTLPPSGLPAISPTRGERVRYWERNSTPSPRRRAGSGLGRYSSGSIPL